MGNELIRFYPGAFSTCNAWCPNASWSK